LRPRKDSPSPLGGMTQAVVEGDMDAANGRRGQRPASSCATALLLVCLCSTCPPSVRFRGIPQKSKSRRSRVAGRRGIERAGTGWMPLGWRLCLRAVKSKAPYIIVEGFALRVEGFALRKGRGREPDSEKETRQGSRSRPRD
jgi:hypothetical protein